MKTFYATIKNSKGKTIVAENYSEAIECLVDNGYCTEDIESIENFGKVDYVAKPMIPEQEEEYREFYYRSQQELAEQYTKYAEIEKLYKNTENKYLDLKINIDSLICQIKGSEKKDKNNTWYNWAQIKQAIETFQERQQML